MDLLVVIVMLVMPLMSLGSPRCDERGIATYNLTFAALWSRQNFPKQYPLFRPHAQWTKTLGRSHSTSYRLWELGELASLPLKQFAETGTTALLDEDSQGKDGVLDIFSTPMIDRGTGEVASKIFVDTAHSRVSLVARIVPSPDWFVGVDSLELCQDGEWQDEVNIELHPHDAGTDKGFTFTAPNWPEDPPLPISLITSKVPNHPANSFYYPQKESLPPIGRYTLTLLSSYHWVEGAEETPAVVETEQQLEEEEELAGITGDAVMEEELHSTEEETEPTEDPNAIVDCEISEWSDWGSCSKTCGFGTRTRTRDILQQPRNYGTPCPLVTEDELCGSMRSCGWKHFNFGGKRNQWARSRTWIQS